MCFDKNWWWEQKNSTKLYHRGGNLCFFFMSSLCLCFLTLGLTTRVFFFASRHNSAREDGFGSRVSKKCALKKGGKEGGYTGGCWRRITCLWGPRSKEITFEAHYEFMNFDMQSPPGMWQIYINHFWKQRRCFVPLPSCLSRRIRESGIFFWLLQSFGTKDPSKYHTKWNGDVYVRLKITCVTPLRKSNTRILK